MSDPNKAAIKSTSTAQAAHPEPAQSPTSQHARQPGPVQGPEHDSNTFLSEGKSNAMTINFPFTVIPGLPAFSKMLKRIDKTTQQDLGFTVKATAEKISNPQGEKDLQLSVDYIGFGLMSSKFNMQFSPVSIKVESGTHNTKPHWGCSASVLSSPIGLVHERAGIKGTFSDCNSTRTFNAAPEMSYQRSSKFKPLSTATGGYFFGDKATFRIPAEYVPTLERIKAAGPDMEEWGMILDHIAPAIPAIQIGKLIDQNIEIAGNIIKSVTTSAGAVTNPASEFKIDNINKLTQQADTQSPVQPAVSIQGKNTSPVPTNKSGNNNRPGATSAPIKITHEDNTIKKQQVNQSAEPSSEKKPPDETISYTVQQNDTLTKIGKKTGYSWTEIFALNKDTLKNNPDKIYPGQGLLIPKTHDHATLLNNPIVQQRIKENLAKQHIQQSLTI